MNHCCFFQVAGVTIRVESDLPFVESTFSPRLKVFALAGPVEEDIRIRHHFGLPDLHAMGVGEKFAEQADLTVYRKTDSWIYCSRAYDDVRRDFMRQIAIVDSSHANVEVFSERESIFRRGDLAVLSFFPSDWLLLANVFANRQGCMFHSAGAILDGGGFLFVGHSGAGKSTMVRMLQDRAAILCDERNVVRRENDGYRVHGTWTHGEIPIFSSDSAPLKAVLFLRQAAGNRAVPVSGKLAAVSRLIACAYKPLVTVDWLGKTLSFIEGLARAVPCYHLEFGLSGNAADLLRSL